MNLPIYLPIYLPACLPACLPVVLSLVSTAPLPSLISSTAPPAGVGRVCGEAAGGARPEPPPHARRLGRLVGPGHPPHQHPLPVRRLACKGSWGGVWGVDGWAGPTCAPSFTAAGPWPLPLPLLPFIPFLEIKIQHTQSDPPFNSVTLSRKPTHQPNTPFKTNKQTCHDTAGRTA